MGTTMAAATVATTKLPKYYCSTSGKQIFVISSSSSSIVLARPRSLKSHHHIVRPHLGCASSSAWSGLKHPGIGISLRRSRKESKEKCRGRMVFASLFGVGAPEALVIGVVALLVFGPKGLAEVARTLGKTLRAFQPTIRELQDVSREFKSTLEREIGLDEVQSSLRSTYTSNPSVSKMPPAAIDSNGPQPTSRPYSSEDLLKITEEQQASSTGSQAQTTSVEDQSEEVRQEVTTTTNSPVVSPVMTPATSVADALSVDTFSTPAAPEVPVDMAASEPTIAVDHSPSNGVNNS